MPPAAANGSGFYSQPRGLLAPGLLGAFSPGRKGTKSPLKGHSPLRIPGVTRRVTPYVLFSYATTFQFPAYLQCMGPMPVLTPAHSSNEGAGCRAGRGTGDSAKAHPREFAGLKTVGTSPCKVGRRRSPAHLAAALSVERTSPVVENKTKIGCQPAADALRDS